MNLVRPFTLGVWGALVVALSLSSSYFMLKARESEHRGTTFLALLCAMLSQSTPRVLQPRLLAALWLLACLIITTAYTSKLVGIFTKPTFTARITSISQLADSTIRLAVHDNGGFTSDTLKRSQSNGLQSFHDRIDLYLQEAQVVEAMVAGTHGFVGGITHFMMKLTKKYEVKAESWYHVREPLFTGNAAWMFKKHTPLKHKFDIYIKRLVQAGIIDHWYKTELRAMGFTDEGKKLGEGGQGGEGTGQPLTTSHLQGLFSLLGLVWAVSTVVFLLEMIQKPLCCPRSLPDSHPA